MTACLSIVFAIVHLAGQASEAPASAPAVFAPARVVANRSSVPEVAPEPPAASGEADAEDRPIERRGARIARTAAGPDGAVARGGSRGTDAGWFSRISSLWPLAVVLGLIGTLVLLAKRLLPRQWRGPLGGRGMVVVLGRQSVAARQSVALLKVGRRIVLVGMTPDRLTHLDTITDPDEVAELVGRSASGKTGSLTSVFEREVLGETAAYEPSADVGRTMEGDGPAPDREEAYVAARQQLRGLLTRVRSLTGST